MCKWLPIKNEVRKIQPLYAIKAYLTYLWFGISLSSNALSMDWMCWLFFTNATPAVIKFFMSLLR